MKECTVAGRNGAVSPVMCDNRASARVKESAEVEGEGSVTVWPRDRVEQRGRWRCNEIKVELLFAQDQDGQSVARCFGDEARRRWFGHIQRRDSD